MLKPLLLASVLAIAAPAAAQEVQAISAADKQLGARANPQLLAEFGGKYAGPQAAYVEQVGKRVAVQSGLSNAQSDFTVALLDSPVENAFAIPGGYIYVTRQLLGIMNSEAELASVMGHEVGHVAARHSSSRNRTSTIGSVLAAVVGAAAGNSTAGQLAGRAASGAAQLYSLKYGRDQEYAADGLGVRYITKAGYDPYAAADMLAQLDASTSLNAEIKGGQQGRLPSWASTHPNGPDRVRRAARLAEEAGRPMTEPPQDTAFLRRLDGLRFDAAESGRRIRIRTVRAGETIDTFARQMAYPDFKRERFVTLNALEDDQPLRAGMLVKVVTTG
ncbi:M48 family metalloprotease [Sphingomonas corticis]|jgi:predicted Zn-dependent protease|uniref:M48 family metalloprotease n=1 Tax=Sphingomonas corticis TaxID=2722791 RepID=A0ABX1CIE2_9SPHN|nr:M48 family metalloprotease [Sphingomonas corticis]NJR77743.1 M48 family metalloprotease [Sphingomonas corticis]